MQQSRLSSNRALRLRLVVILIFATLAGMLFVCSHLPSNAAELNTDPQQRQRGTRGMQRRRVAPAPGRNAAYYSKFTHDIAGHGGGNKESCLPCHTVASQQRSDIKDYPGHDSCINCHRQQFFAGARPAICSVCHTVVSPRSGARFNFPKPIIQSQFTDIFPHREHLSSSTRLAFAKLPDAKKKALSVQDTCFHCHKVNETNLEEVAAKWPKKSFVPTPGTFMTSPTGHASCIDCHWKAAAPNEKSAYAVYEPFINSCSECHKNTLLKAPAKPATSNAPKSAATDKNGAADKSAAAEKKVAAEKNAPVDVKIVPAHFVVPALPPALMEVTEAWSARISPKYQHAIPSYDAKPKDDPHRTSACTDCHKQVSKVSTLETFRQKENNVQLSACIDCHGDKSGKTKVAAIARELKEREQNPKFDCVYCHSSNIGTRVDGFDDHYKAIKRTKPQPTPSGGDKK